ncbi:MAG: hypothetical protein O3C57_08740 [Verrucomicrobia bacterium]|nr:hypothetical protein [Verrucomicrobiota bacterium]
MKTVFTYKLLGVFALLVTLALLAGSLLRGELNQDEGWYLYGARLVAQGQTPYLDFATTQGPVMPYVYALVDPLVRIMGLAGGRLFTGLLGLACILLSAFLAYRCTRRHGPASALAAGLITLCLLGINVFQAYFFTLVKTYALSGLLLVSGFVALSYLRRYPRACALLAGVLLMLAGGTRASAAFALPAVFLVMVVTNIKERKRSPCTLHPCGWRWFLAGAVITGLALFVPFLVVAPQALWFAMVEYHTGRQPGSLIQGLAYKAGFLSRCIQDYSTAVVLLLSVLAARMALRQCEGATKVQADAGHSPMRGMLWFSIAAISFVHFMAPFPYDDYQAVVYPLFCVVLAKETMALLARVDNKRWEQGIVIAVLLCCTALATSSPLLHSWFLAPRDRIWWPLREKAPLAVLQETARYIRNDLIAEGGLEATMILTQDPYLAVEAGLSLPPGFELGQFCYFPDWDSGKARACHVLNAAQFRAALENGEAQIAAFSAYGLAIRSPAVQPLTDEESNELWKLVTDRYREVRRIEPFGQADTALRILIRR